MSKTKNDISENIFKNDAFKKILNFYNIPETTASTFKIKNDYKNGLCEKGILIRNKSDNSINTIIVPVFSTEKTITWDFRFNDSILNNLPSEFNSMTSGELTKYIKTTLFFLDKSSGELIFNGMFELEDWLNHGRRGANSKSVYFWNNSIPVKHTMKKADIENDLFVSTLEFKTDDELKSLCNEYAQKHYSKFNNTGNRESSKIIKNISSGLFAEIKTYLYMINKGHNVNMFWRDGDDLGIDIQYICNDTIINIDVKSTKTKDLKISRHRKETDFYAVCTYDKYGKLDLTGFLSKHKFWKSNIYNTEAPKKGDDKMYHKSLISLQDDMLEISDLLEFKTNHELKAMKYKSRLFDIV